MNLSRLSAGMLALLLAGCNAASPDKPVAQTPSAAESAEPSSAGDTRPAAGRNSAAPAGEQPSAAANSVTPSSPVQSGFDQLSGRLTLLQEQVLQLRTQSGQLLEQNRMLLNRMQLLTSPAADRQSGSEEDASDQLGDSAGATEQLDAAIGQLMQVMNQMDAPVEGGGQFALTTTYTRDGAWILLKYDRFSGATWLADAGSWRLLGDVDYLEPSTYRVLLHRADKDTKGYVAVRMDEQTGQSWWLNDNRWQEYEQ
ncbi:hypothetical protein [Marinobacterium weihaiense]|uniref:Uncharacterized protein n=1 Tax=Marinobacterium weihaiense TaxID=2851016 RepID=A0ABS6MCW6_9GAMM|nr:hypothetical protein [Marinobacterium weihaiense]MBV0933572.1 hypothetical protein [Marinobacterium weihaiense]